MSHLRRIPRVEDGRPGRFAWYLAGPEGIVQFVAGPLDMPLGLRIGVEVEGRHWTGIDVGCHSPRPLYEGQEPMDTCHLFDGVTCYYDGSGLAADELLRRWATAGCDDEIIWAELTERYQSWLCGNEAAGGEGE